MRVAIYIRVSTEEQAKEGYSISAQKQKLKAYCISQGWETVNLYVDEGLSAKDMNRPDLKRLIEDIKQEKIDCVLVYRLDRLTRSVLDLYKMLETFDKYKCKFKSATEVFDTTNALGRMFITIVAAMAQWERENTGERVSMGFHEKARQGKYALNFRSFGYELDLNTGLLSINEEEAKIVKLIVDLYLNKNMGGNRICKYLNAHNVPTRDGNTWNDKPLMQILKNPLYMGTIKYGSVINENSVPPIIDKETFDLIQATIEKRRGLKPKQVASKYVFSGTLKCAYCGNSMVGNGGHNTLANGEKVIYRYYVCAYKKNGQCTKGRSYSENRIENCFIKYLEQLNLPYEEVATVGEKHLNKENEIDKKRGEILKELEKLEQRKKKWQYAWANERLSDEDFDKRMQEEKTLENSLEDQLSKYEVVEEEVKTDKTELIQALKDLSLNWTKLTKEEKKGFIQMFIRDLRIEYNDKNEIFINHIDFY